MRSLLAFAGLCFQFHRRFFTFICSYDDPVGERQVLPLDVVEEVLCAAVLLPLARASLRAPLRVGLSISDASERGGSAAESESFVPSLATFFGEDVSALKSALNEQMARRRAPEASFCGVCTAECSSVARCGPGCGLLVCSFDCYRVHRIRRCPRIFDSRCAMGLVAIGKDPGWGWSLLCQQIEVAPAAVNSSSFSIPSVVIVCWRLPLKLLKHKFKKRSLRGIFAVSADWREGLWLSSLSWSRPIDDF